jgi:hypothetical protein
LTINNNKRKSKDVSNKDDPPLVLAESSSFYMTLSAKKPMIIILADGLITRWVERNSTFWMCRETLTMRRGFSVDLPHATIVHSNQRRCGLLCVQTQKKVDGIA